LSFLHNYFDSPTKFSNMYLAKFLDITTKSFFPNEKVITKVNVDNISGILA